LSEVGPALADAGGWLASAIAGKGAAQGGKNG